MKKIETVAFAGLGAIGASYLSKISRRVPMQNIMAVASGARADRVASGVEVNGEKYFFPVFSPGDAASPADLMIFATKHHHLEQATRDSRGLIGGNTIIMSFLNGVSSEEILIREFGENVLYSVVMGVDATRDGDSTAYSTLGSIQFGEAENEEGRYSPNVITVREFFERVGIRCEILSDMKWALWKKFMLNVGANQISAVLRCPYKTLQNSPEAREIMRGAMTEAAAVAAREGVSLTDGDIADAFERIGRLSTGGRTSMAQDVDAGRKTEVEIFGGAVVEMGRAHGVPTPVNEFLVKMIKAIESSYM